VHLNPILSDAVELLAYRLRVDDVEVVMDLAEELPVLWADPHQLHQVAVNLTTNAHDAMRKTPPPRRISLRTSSDPGRGRVVLEVADTGPGIPPEIQARIFEPVFTTKPVGQGTGLGLSLCLGLVEGHGGTLTLAREVGQGAVFRVTLPVQAPPARAGSAAAGGSHEPGITGKRILIADDEPEVLEVLANFLREDHHVVDSVGDGAEALDRLARAYGLIFSDVRMPRLDGLGLYRALERRAPALARQFVLVTGDVLNDEVRTFLAETGVPSLSKPFDLAEVRRLVQRLLPGAR
jgi:CheY-like chemotaxis protein